MNNYYCRKVISHSIDWNNNRSIDFKKWKSLYNKRYYREHPEKWGYTSTNSNSTRSGFMDVLANTPLVDNIQASPEIEAFIEEHGYPSFDEDENPYSDVASPEDIENFKEFIRRAVNANMYYNINLNKTYTPNEILAYGPAMIDLIKKQLRRFAGTNYAALKAITDNDIASEVGKALRQTYDLDGFVSPFGKTRPMARPKSEVTKGTGVKVRKPFKGNAPSSASSNSYMREAYRNAASKGANKPRSYSASVSIGNDYISSASPTTSKSIKTLFSKGLSSVVSAGKKFIDTWKAGW